MVKRRSFPALFGCLALLAACDGPQTPASHALPPLSVKTVEVADGSQPTILRLPATLLRDREARLGFRSSGTIQFLPVRQGETLPRGALVAALDQTALHAATVRAEAEVERLRREVARYGVLNEAGAIGAAQRLDAASAMRAAEASLDAARFDEAGGRITMPFRGAVLTRNAEVGDVVSADQAVVVVADLDSPLLVRVNVPDRLAETLKVGDTLAIELPGDATARALPIWRIGAKSDSQTGTLAIDLQLPSEVLLPSGVVATAYVSDQRAPQRRGGLLPVGALLSADHDHAEVYVVDGQPAAAHRVSVQLLGVEGEFARVSGVPAGRPVITEGAGFVSDGQHVVVAK